MTVTIHRPQCDILAHNGVNVKWVSMQRMEESDNQTLSVMQSVLTYIRVVVVCSSSLTDILIIQHVLTRMSDDQLVQQNIIVYMQSSTYQLISYLINGDCGICTSD